MPITLLSSAMKRQVLDLLSTGVVQPKFSNSRTLMFMREVLCGRQKASLMLHVRPGTAPSPSPAAAPLTSCRQSPVDADKLMHTLMWLELAAHLGLKKSKTTVRKKPVVEESAKPAASAAKTKEVDRAAKKKPPQAIPKATEPKEPKAPERPQIMSPASTLFSTPMTSHKPTLALKNAEDGDESIRREAVNTTANRAVASTAKTAEFPLTPSFMRDMDLASAAEKFYQIEAQQAASSLKQTWAAGGTASTPHAFSLSLISLSCAQRGC